MDATPQGMSAAFLGWFWDGTECLSHYAPRCSGANCDDGFATREECESVFAACVDP
jgi:hypothetical protein